MGHYHFYIKFNLNLLNYGTLNNITFQISRLVNMKLGTIYLPCGDSK